MSHPIVERLAHLDPDVRGAACREAAADPAATLLVEPLAEMLGDPHKAVARAASDALVEIERGPGAHAAGGAVAAAVREALHSDEPRRRWGAAFTLARLQPPHPRLIPALVEALASPDGDVRWAAARLLVETGRLHGEVLPVLLGLVRTGELAMLRRMATFALRELAPDLPDAAHVLIEATRDADLHVRRAAFTAFASLMGPPRAVFERLSEALADDPDAASRRLAALAMGELGAAGDVPREPSLAALRAAGKGSPDPDLRRAVERALARLGGASAP